MLFLLLEAKEEERDVDDDKEEEEEEEEEEVVGLNCPLIKVPVVVLMIYKYNSDVSGRVVRSFR